MRPSVVMQQNDLPTSLSSKWSFVFNCIEQISQLTTLVLGSNRLTWLKEFIKQHILNIPPDALKDFFWRECLALPLMLLAVWGLPMNVCV
uniref:Uncharacterized protein n=1 Tax=Heterorhabditis bacteriophora TaxID=37862 RepID=A0A1I7XRJ8_HETBA